MTEKKKIEKKLNEQFGIENIEGSLIRIGEEKLFLFQGDFNEKKLKLLEEQAQLERVGIYFGKIQGNEIRLSIEGSQILKKQIKKNIFELTWGQTEQWMMGRELDIQTGKRGFLVIKYGGDFLGCGKASENKIGNFIPKTRRLKNKKI